MLSSLHVVLGALADRQHAIKKPTYASTQVEVEACLEAVVSAFDKCGKALGIELSLDLDIDLQIQSIDW